MNGGWGISYEIALKWMPLDLADDKSTLVHQAITWANADPDLCGQMASLGHNELMYGIKNNAWVTVNNNFFVTSEAIRQWF